MYDPLIWSLLLLLLALVLLVLELFIPSGGVLGVLAAVAVAVAVVMAFFDSRPYVGPIVSVVAVVGVPLTIYVAVRFWPQTPLGNLILIRNPPGSGSEYQEATEQLKTLIGKHGVAKSKMLPSGLVVIESKTYDAVSDGVPVEADQPIRVIAIRNNRPVVRPVEGAKLAPHEPERQAPLDQDLTTNLFDDLDLD